MNETRGHEREERPEGAGPLAGSEPEIERPIEDPVLSDRANPRWDDEPADQSAEDRAEEPAAQSLRNPDGTPNVLPSSEPPAPLTEDELERGTPQDQAARAMEPEVGRDNIREGRGGGTPNPALAEGGDNG
jgi:hypothetical protein